MRYSRALVLLFLSAGASVPHDIITTKLTYTRDISRIFVQRCVSCHSNDASIPLTSYEQVRPWAVSIKEQVLSRAMPPWGAVKGFGQFKPDGGLTQEEMIIIAAWVVGGAPQGDVALLPSIQKTFAIERSVKRELTRIAAGTTLRSSLRVVAIAPSINTVVDSARVTANLPDGRIEPLIWLYKYDRGSNRSFHLRNALDLPAGTVIQSTKPLSLDLETVKLP